MIPLNDATAKRVRVLFRVGHRSSAANLLATECAENLHLPLIDREHLLERIRFSVLRLSGGSIDELATQVEAAKSDWRGVVRSAGFGESRTAHQDWYPLPNKPMQTDRASRGG